MKTFTTADIRSWNPCYDPAVHLPEDWSGTVLDLLSIEAIPSSDRLWVVLRDELIDARTLRLFAVWCARQCNQTDARCIAAIDCAERYANGLATDDELSSAWSATTRDAARYAAWYAAREAAWYAANEAARYAARYAANDAAWYAAMYAAWYAARAAASDAASDAANDAQVQQLVSMLSEVTAFPPNNEQSCQVETR